MSSSLNDSKDSEKSLCELSSHDFAQIKETITFVDKTLFIKCVLSDTSKIVLLTAPRAFGKTTLMDMMHQFLLGKTSLFENLKICTEEARFFSKHCKPHPVIHIDLGSVRGSSLADVKQQLALAINRTFRQHEYLVKRTDDGTLAWTSEKLNISLISVKHFEHYYDEEKYVTLSEPDLEYSLRFLSEVLHTHYEEKVFLLIDEYDAPAIGLVFSKSDEIELVSAFLQNFMGATLKSNNFRKRVLIFACVRLAGAFSGNATRLITHYPFLSDVRYAPYLGFTYEEVKQLLDLPEVKAACGEVSLEEIAEWYDGYMVSGGSLKIFSSWSVLNFLETAYTSAILKYSSFWIDTSHIRNLKHLFAKPLIRQKIEELTSRREIKIRTDIWLDIERLKSLQELISLEFDEISWKSVDIFLEFLADSGYFNMSFDEKKYEIETKTEDEEEDEEDDELDYNLPYCILKIPNFEINQYISNVCYSEALTIMSENNLNVTFIQRYLSALKLVLESTSEKAFVDLANAILGLLSQSSQRIIKEKDLHHILHTLAYNSRYFITHSEVEINKPIDMVIMSKYVGIIFEYKVNSMSANEALKQVFAKQYYTKFDEPNYNHISKKIYVGLAFNAEKKKVFITYQVGTEGKSKSVCSDTLL